MPWWTPDRIAYAVNYLISNGGLSPYGAAGLVARWAFVESVASGPAAVNPYSGAFGIAQWLGARKAGINGNTNFDSQLDYAIQELNGNEGRAGNILRGAGDAYTAAVGASSYERAEGYSAATGVDNFTNRTASNTPGVLAIWQSAYGSADASQAAQTAEGETQTRNPADAGAADVSLIIGVGIGALVLLYLLTD